MTSPLTPQRKRALLIGINYYGTPFQLSGCINDVDNVRAFLLKERGFAPEEIVLMHDYHRSASDALYPSRAHILEQIDALVADAAPGDYLFFHYSGHGSYVSQSWQKRKQGDEDDGRDETICPVDCDSAGMLIDDDLRRLLVDSLPQGATLRAIFDCCHSGTILDCRYTFKPSSDGRRLVKSKNLHIPLSKADVLMISGCLDFQTSADAFIAGKSTGALTFAFLDSVKKLGSGANCSALLSTIHRFLRDGRYSQRPLLSSGVKVALDSAPFL